MTITAGAKTMFVGLLIMFAGYAGFTLVHERAGYWIMAAGWTIIAIGFGMHLRAGRIRR